MRPATVLAILLLAPALAGCIGGQEPGVQPASTDASAGSLPAGAPGPSAPDRTLTEPPQLRLGEWWQVRIHSQLDGSTHTARLVVTGAANGSYRIGMPAEDFVHEVLILHLPGIGEVDRSTFGYEVHDTVFEPLRFPLQPGATWQTAWYTGALEAEVVDASQGQARVELVGNNTRINVTYEPGLGLPRSVEVAGYGSYEVLDHGYGYEGKVLAPTGRDLVILNGRIGPVLDTTLMPAPPVESVQVDEGYDRLTGALVLGNLVVDGAPGVYRAEATAPDGSTYTAAYRAGPQGPGVSITTFLQEDPSGTWELEFEAAGPGVAAVEAVAYDVVERTVTAPGS